jgi:glutathione S-transferase
MSSRQASVVLFDIPSECKGKCWSPNVWVTRSAISHHARFSLSDLIVPSHRLLLNHKKILHTTRWIEYPDIKPLFLELGIPPSGKNSQGEDAYTCPTIQYFPADGSSPFYITDSWTIATFLEERHPEPPAFPNGSLEEQTKLGLMARGAILAPLLLPLMRNSFWTINEASRPYFRETKERYLGKKMEEMCPGGELRTTLEIAKMRSEEFLKSFPSDAGPYLYGENVTYLDFVVASIFLWLKSVAEEELWPECKQWSHGRWKQLLKNFELEGYSKVY